MPLSREKAWMVRSRPSEMVTDCVISEREGWPVPFGVELQVAGGMPEAYGIVATC